MERIRGTGVYSQVTGNGLTVEALSGLTTAALVTYFRSAFPEKDVFFGELDLCIPKGGCYCMDNAFIRWDACYKIDIHNAEQHTLAGVPSRSDGPQG